jgi:hypothetical protein
MDVVLATLFFILLSPGLLLTLGPGANKSIGGEETSNIAVIVHAVLFFILNTAVNNDTWGIFHYFNEIPKAIEGTPRSVPTVIATLAFIILSPGLVVTIPAFDGDMFFSQQTNTLAILVHAVLFYIGLRLYNDNSTNEIVKWINNNVAAGL